MLTSMLAGSAIAGTLSGNDLLHSLADNCDASLFRYLKQNEAAAVALAPAYTKDDLLFFKVKDSTSSQPDNIIPFTSSVKADALEIVGYSDSYINLGKDGRYYNWGFVAKGSPDEVFKKLPVAISSQLRKDGDVFIKAEWKPANDSTAPWRAGSNTPSGKPPQPGTVERLLMLESTSDNETLIVCSLQGTVTQDTLKAHRPDLHDKIYDNKVIKQKWEIAINLVKNYKLKPIFNSNAEMQNILQNDISALKKSKPDRQPAYWQKMTKIQENFLKSVARDEPENEKKLQALMALLMVNMMDVDQLQNTPADESPIITLVRNNIASVEQLVKLEAGYHYGNALQEKVEALKILEADHDALRSN